MTTSRLPLTGIRVVDMTEVWAGPMATSYLADWGAEVIRVESFPRYETLRPVVAAPGGLGFSHNDPTGPQPWERFARRFIANHSKRGIAINIREPRGRDALLQLVSVSDVVVENYASETMERLNLGYDVLRAHNPRIIMACVSGWGGGGPYAGYTAMGSGVDATTGHSILRGYVGDDPTTTNQGYQSDAMAPLVTVLAVAAALRERTRTGLGRRIELSEAEVMLTALARPVIDAALNGRPGAPIANGHEWAAPHGCYPCRGEDRWITIAVESDAQWQALCDVLGVAALGADPEYATVRARWEQRERLDAVLSEWTVIWDDIELMEALQAQGVAAAAVYDEWDTMHDQQLRARGFWLDADHPIVGERTYARTPWRMDGLEPAPYRPANQLGEDNEWVLRDLLGMSASEVAALAADRITGTAYA
jgi:benzylsuccinate CoA-transferase BbsF subunit